MNNDTEQQASIPDVTDQAIPSPDENAPIPPPKKNGNKLLLLLGGAVILVILAGAVLGFQSGRSNSRESTQTAPTPTYPPVPVPQGPRNIAPIASSSAFVDYQGEVASFSATLHSFALPDTTLVPPTYELELGIQN